MKSYSSFILVDLCSISKQGSDSQQENTRILEFIFSIKIRCSILDANAIDLLFLSKLDSRHVDTRICIKMLTLLYSTLNIYFYLTNKN
jgi:hypothetical protein